MTSIPRSHESASHLPMVHSMRGIAYETYRILQFVFVVAPIVAGLDKFFNLLTDWPRYLAGWIPSMLHVTGQQFMWGVGVIEIVAGIMVAIKPRIFGYVVALWLCGIIVNLVSTGMYFDVALRDLGLAVSAVAMARLAEHFDFGPMGGLLTRRTTTESP